jgi:hypothetical protein
MALKYINARTTAESILSDKYMICKIKLDSHLCHLPETCARMTHAMLPPIKKTRPILSHSEKNWLENILF